MEGMSLPRLFLHDLPSASEGLLVPLDAQQARHLSVLRIRPGDALELILPQGPWKGDLAELQKNGGHARLVAPLDEQREPPFPIQAWIPITAQLSLVDDMLPSLVELGATQIHPVAYARSEFDARKAASRMERWQRIVTSACEQSHRTRIPILQAPVPFQQLLIVELTQKWVAYEQQTGLWNPRLRPEPLAFTSGPEGGITPMEFEALQHHGWQPVSLGKSILRAVTAPGAMLGAIQHQMLLEP